MNQQKMIGERIRKAREDLGLTQQAFGDKVGYSAMGISYFEKGLRPITISLLQKMAEVLKIDITFLIEPVAGVPSIPNTTYGRIADDLTEEQKKEVDEKVNDFDKYVEELLKK